MSKLVALALVGGGAATASVFSAYMLGAFGSGIEIPQTKEDMEKWNGGVCNYFNSNLSKLKVEASDIQEDSSFNGSTFFTTTGAGAITPQTNGCLIVNWDKTKHEGANANEHKWTGTFRFLWTLIKGDKGLMVFALAEARGFEDNKKLKFYGSAYALENKSAGEGKGKRWTVVKKKDIADNKEMVSGDVANKFPKPFSTASGLAERWKFIDSTDDYSKIKGTSDSGKALGTTYLRGHWKFVSTADTASGTSGSQKAHDWSSNMDQWWPDLYGNNGGTGGDTFNAKTMTDSITGKWENLHLSGNPKPTLTSAS